MDLQKQKRLVLCDKFFTTCFINHKILCRDVEVPCSKSSPTFDNFYFKDMLGKLAEDKLEHRALNAKNVAAYISIILKRGKSFYPINETLIKYTKSLPNTFINNFRIRYIENYIRKIFDKKSSSVKDILDHISTGGAADSSIKNVYKDNLCISRIFPYKKCFDETLNLLESYLAVSK